MSDVFDLSADKAAAAAVTVVCIYLAFVLFVRLTGPRSLTGLSSFDLACVIALGAILGRTALLENPSLGIGLVALATFMIIQGLLGWGRRFSIVDRAVNGSPTVLVREGALDEAQMRRAHVSEDDLRQALRRAGLGGLSQAAHVILERNGSLSVIATGVPVDPWLLADLKGDAAEPPRGLL